MIPGSAALRQVPAWQAAIAQAVTDPAELLALLQLGEEWRAPAEAAAQQFPLRVPRGFVARMRKADPHDPLLRQILPLGDELVEVEGFGADPVGDSAALRTPGLLHKYAGRVLLAATGACAVHCRYCFRRHFPYDVANSSADRWQAALGYIAGDASLIEVILSGGDPLTLADRRLREFVQAVAAIPHVRRLRVHTRLPVVLPERVTPELCRLLSESRLQTVLVMHANHAQELDSQVHTATARLAGHGITLLNQSVLLRGVNDRVDTLVALSEALFATGVLPYYLHLLDKVRGAAHFDVPEARARELHAGLQTRLPGYLVPRLVRELAGADSKIAV